MAKAKPNILQNRIRLAIDGTQGDEDMMALLGRFREIYARHVTFVQPDPSVPASGDRGRCIFMLSPIHDETRTLSTGYLLATPAANGIIISKESYPAE
jgi:hypothetical protein